MSYYDDYEKRREERREKERRYRGDVLYDVWRAGGNPDAIDYDRVSDSYRRGLDDDEAARVELRAQRRQREHPSEEEYYDDRCYDEREPACPEPEPEMPDAPEEVQS